MSAKKGSMATTYTVQFNQFNQHIIVNAQPVDSDASFTMRIDPRNYFPPLGEQLAYYRQNPGLLARGICYANQQLGFDAGAFMKSHDLEMCESTKVGVRVCSLACPKIHHYPVYLALGGQPIVVRKPKAEPPIPEMPGLKAFAGPTQESSYFGPKPLKIDEYVYQPIQALNRETDKEEKARQVGK
jgi:hypothetical protein